MPNRTEAATRKPRPLATGRLTPLRLFSTPPANHKSHEDRQFEHAKSCTLHKGTRIESP
jgi:hypothetical protein